MRWSNFTPFAMLDITSIRSYFIGLVLLLAATSLLQGCVGVGAGFIGDGSKMENTPRLFRGKGNYARSTYGQYDFEKAFTFSDVDSLRKYWGEPDNVDYIGPGREIWEYSIDSLRWHGALLWVVIVPIPAIVPFGREYLLLEIEEGYIKSVKKITSTNKFGFLCGFWPTAHNPGSNSGIYCGPEKR